MNYAFGETITLINSDGTETEYKIGSVIGEWSISMALPGVGVCGLYPVKTETKE